MDSVDALWKDGQEIVLNQRPYRIENSVGSGFVTVAYKAVPLDAAAEAPIIIKRLDPARADQDKIDGLRHEAVVLRTLNEAEHGKPEDRRRIIAVLDSGDLPSGLPFVIQELAPGKVFSPFEIESFVDERQMLAVAAAVAEAMALAHQHQLAFDDFEPNTKRDRIFLQWLSEGHDAFKMRIIDWNITGGPEDIAQDLIYLGGYLYYLFTGEHLVLVDNKPNLDVLQWRDAWQRLTLGTRQVIQRLLNLDSTGTYEQAGAAYDDLTWWHGVMMSAETAAPALALQEAITKARTLGRNERVVAVADLVTRLDVSPDERAMFEKWAEGARQKLDQSAMASLSKAEVLVSLGSYDQAIRMFDETLGKFTRDDARARSGRISRLWAQAGYDIKTTLGRDPRPEKGWSSIESAVKALEYRRWAVARDDLAKAAESWPKVEPLKALQDWARAGLKVDEALRQIEGAGSSATDSVTRWMQEEEAHLETLGSAVKLLEQAVKSAPGEPEFRQHHEAQQGVFEKRKNIMSRYKTAEMQAGVAEQLVKEGMESEAEEKWSAAAEHYCDAITAWEKAFGALDQIRDANPDAALTDWRSRWPSEKSEAKRHLDLAETFVKVNQLLAQGDYEEALNHLHAAEQQYGQNNAKIMAFTRQAEDGVAHIEMTQTRLNTVQDLLRSRDLERLKQARPLVAELYKENANPYRYPKTLVDALSKTSQLIRELENTLPLLEDARRTHNAEKVKEHLEKLQGIGVALTEEELAELREVSQQAADQNTLKQLMDRRPETLLALQELINKLSELEKDPAARREKTRVLHDWHERLRGRKLAPDWPADIDKLIDDIEGSTGLGIVLPPALDTQLRDDLALARKAKRIIDLLYGQDGAPTTWLEDPSPPTDDMRDKLTELTASLDELGRVSDWPAMAELVKSGRQTLQKQIKVYHDGQIDSLCRRAKVVAPFSTAALKAVRLDVASCLEFIRQARDIPVTRLQNLLVALDGRIDAEEILSGLVSQLSAEEGVVSALDDLNTRLALGRARYLVIENDDVPTDHINVLPDQLRTLAVWGKASSAALDFQTQTDYSDGIAQLRHLTNDAQLDILPGLQALSAYVEKTKGRLLEKEKSLSAELNRETEKARQALRTSQAGEKRDIHRYSLLFTQQQTVGDDDSKHSFEREHARLIDDMLSYGETALREFASFDQLRSARDDFADAGELIRLGQTVREANPAPSPLAHSPQEPAQQMKLDQFKSPVDQLISLFEHPENQAKVDRVLANPVEDPLPLLKDLYADLRNRQLIDTELAIIETDLNKPLDNDAWLNNQQTRIETLDERIKIIRPGSGKPADWVVERLQPWLDAQAERVAALRDRVRHQRAMFLFSKENKVEERVRGYLDRELDAGQDKEAKAFIEWAINDVTADPGRRSKLMSIVVRVLDPTAPPEKGKSRFKAWLSGLRRPGISIPRPSRPRGSAPTSSSTSHSASHRPPPNKKVKRPPPRDALKETSQYAKQAEQDQGVGQPDNTQESEK